MLNILRLLRIRSPILTIDGIILKGNRILLIKRSIPPFRGYWVLPGGHVKYGETVESAVTREMKEELGISARIKKIVGIYSGPNRHPYYHAIAIVYLLERINDNEIRLNFEGSEYRYFTLKDLPSRIGFDHREIIKNFFNSLNNKK